MTTTLSAVPFDNSPILDEATWRAFMRHARGSGVIREYPTDPDKLNEYEVYADSTGMQIKVKTGVAWVRGVFAPNASERTEAISAAHATLDRIDRVVLKLDTVNRTVTLEVVAGTAAGSPAAPTLTNTTSIYYIKLAQVFVTHAITTIAANMITDERDWSTDNLFGIPIMIGNGLSAVTTGSKGYIPIPADCTVIGWSVYANASGSIVVDVKKCTYTGFPTTATIWGTGEKPTLSSAQKNRNMVLTTQTELVKGDVLEPNVDSVATVMQVTVNILCVKK